MNGHSSLNLLFVFLLHLFITLLTMPTFRRILSVICTGLVAFSVPVAAETIQGAETVLQARSVVQVKGVVYDTSN